MSALTGETFSGRSLVFLVPLAFVASLFSVVFKAYKFASYSVSNLLGTLFEVTMMNFLLVTTLFQGYIFSNDIDFTRLVLYSLLLTIGYSLGFFILNMHFMEKRWQLLLSNTGISEEQLVQSLIKA